MWVGWAGWGRGSNAHEIQPIAFMSAFYCDMNRHKREANEMTPPSNERHTNGNKIFCNTLLSSFNFFDGFRALNYSRWFLFLFASARAFDSSNK